MEKYPVYCSGCNQKIGNVNAALPRMAEFKCINCSLIEEDRNVQSQRCEHGNPDPMWCRQCQEDQPPPAA